MFDVEDSRQQIVDIHSFPRGPTQRKCFPRGISQYLARSRGGGLDRGLQVPQKLKCFVKTQ